MPWTEPLPTGLHRACWRDAAGKQRSKSGFSQKAAALRYAGDQESRTRRGEAGYTARSITWERWCADWRPLRRVETSSADSDETRLKKWVLPRWGSVPLARITTEDVQIWVGELTPQMSPASVAKVYRLLSASLRAAVKYKRLAFTPCVGIELPIVPPSDERFLTREEFDAALHELNDPYRAAALILVGTGQRFGEMAGLHRHRVMPAAGAIDVHETWNGDQMKAYPKGRRKRRVPMPSWVADAIADLPDLGRRGCGHEHADRKRCTSDLVIRGPMGAPLDSHNMLQRHWLPALERAGVEPATLHDLRHTCASWLIQGGRSMAEIAEVLGHSETSVTARYAHLAGTHMDAVRAVMEGHFPGSAPFVPHDLQIGA